MPNGFSHGFPSYIATPAYFLSNLVLAFSERPQGWSQSFVFLNANEAAQKLDLIFQIDLMILILLNLHYVIYFLNHLQQK